MRIEVDMNNIVGSPVSRSFFEEGARRTLELAGLDQLRGFALSVSLAIVSSKEIRRLNSLYRNKDVATDILSFAEYENLRELEDLAGQDIFLGELILCYDDIASYAEDKKIDLKTELAKVFSHGLLHLLGFSHGEKMFSIQEEVSKKSKFFLCKD